MEQVSWGIIGCGDVCERKSAPPLYQLPDSRLVAVMRRDAAAAADFARRHGVARWYDDLEAFLADPELDTVYVATPDLVHEAGTLAAARAGKHVLVEKAMATSAAACQRMIDCCRQHQVSLAVAYYRRCYPSIVRARELLAKGCIGQVQELRINDEFPLSHRLDLMHFFCGDLASVRQEQGPVLASDHTGSGPVLVARSQSGIEARTRLDWDEQLTPEILQWTGSDGVLTITDLKAGHIQWQRDGQTEAEDCGPLPWMHWGLMADMVDHLRRGSPLACDGVEGRKSTVILDLVDDLPTDGSEQAVDYGVS